MLTTSQRVKLILEISRVLGIEGYPLIDLTLRQFKLRTVDMWTGDSRADYVAEMIEKAEDETLLELASHLGIERTPRPSNIDPSFWLEGHLRLLLQPPSQR